MLDKVVGELNYIYDKGKEISDTVFHNYVTQQLGKLENELERISNEIDLKINQRIKINE